MWFDGGGMENGMMHNQVPKKKTSGIISYAQGRRNGLWRGKE